MIPKGKRFGRWVAVEDQVNLRVLCRCDCGVERSLLAGNLRRRVNATQSCGCLKDELSSARWSTHGDSRSVEWRAWAQMNSRCANRDLPSFHRYGGRGITVCPRWRGSYVAFLADMGRRPTPNHSLDRIDNNGHYEPGNVRWAVPVQQANNTRRSRYLTFEGKTLSVSQWAREIGLTVNTLWNRIDRGWSTERALTTPREEHRPHVDDR